MPPAPCDAAAAAPPPPRVAVYADPTCQSPSPCQLASRTEPDRTRRELGPSPFVRLAGDVELARDRLFQPELFAGSHRAGPSQLASSPTGQYRLLLYRSKSRELMFEHRVPGDKDVWYVLALGCDEVPRCIGWPEVEIHVAPVLVRGNLHWCSADHQTRSKMILVFDTTAESFRRMCSPIVPKSAHLFETYETHLFEIDGMLGMYWHNDPVTMVDIWVMQDYESEIWAFKNRVELPVAVTGGQFQRSKGCRVVVAHVDGDVLVLVYFDLWLFHINSEGKLVASGRHGSLTISSHQLKQSLVQHTFFPALDDYKVNALPFI